MTAARRDDLETMKINRNRVRRVIKLRFFLLYCIMQGRSVFETTPPTHTHTHIHNTLTTTNGNMAHTYWQTDTPTRTLYLQYQRAPQRAAFHDISHFHFPKQRILRHTQNTYTLTYIHMHIIIYTYKRTNAVLYVYLM